MQHHDPAPDRKDYLPRGTLAEVDPDAQRLIRLEDERQRRRIILIASESICPEPVRRATASRFSNIYAEGYPSWRMTEADNRRPLDYVHHLAYYRRYSDGRYYKGCDYVDFAETLAQKRIIELFANDNAPADAIYANVQPLSGAAANNAVYEALVKPGDVVMGMNLAHGGHLTHGSPFNRSGKRYSIVSYGVDPKTGRIDYDEILRLAEEHKPKMLIGGASAYPFHIDWAKLREAADVAGAYLLADIAHPAGLVAAGLFPNPVGIADVVTFTTHKTMCGPRGACILTTNRRIARRINAAVFPGEQGGPHINAIIAKAVAFHLAAQPAFKAQMQRVRENIDAMAETFTRRGVPLVGGKSETHLLMLDLDGIPSPTGLPLKGEVASRILELAGIVLNKNTKPGDTSAAQPGALRIGTVWISQLGFGPKEASELADVIATVLENTHPFRYLESRGYAGRAKVDLGVLQEARARVDALMAAFPVPDDEEEGELDGYPHFPPTTRTIESPPVPAASADETAALASDTLIRLDGARVLELSAERSHYTVHSMTTADTISLERMRGRRGFVLDRHGAPIDDVSILRLADEAPGHRRFLVVTTPYRGIETREWLRALSDGYVLFDADDVFKKVEGPALVVDRTDPMESRDRSLPPLDAFALRGPNARAILEKHFDGAAPDEGAVVEGAFAGARAIVHRTRLAADGDPYYEILVERDGTSAFVEAIGEATATGPGVLASLRADAGLPDYAGAPEDARALEARRPDMFAGTKTYFVGHAHTEGAPALPAYEPAPLDLPMRETMLHGEHVALGGKMVPFGGWEMPVRYEATSLAEEHDGVRNTAGLFDVSHMGVLGFRGEHAQRFLDGITTNYVAWLRDGQCHYSYLCAPDGTVLDDILVYRRAWDDYMVVVNASNAEKDLAWIRAAASGDVCIDPSYPGKRLDGPVEIRDLRDPSSGDDRRIDLALQGPKSSAVLAAAGASDALMKRIKRLKRFEFVEDEIAGIPLLISTTGYTGSAGFELYVHPDNAVAIWRRLLEHGAPLGLIPTGLGARDSTRTEAGYPLYGHELAGDWGVSPIEAGYGAFVKFHKPFFCGRGPLLEHEQSRTRQVVRLAFPGKGVKMVRTGNPVLNQKGDFVGTITSGVLIGERQIALAIVDRRFAKRGTPLNALPLPRRLPKTPPLDQLEKGDSVVLPLSGEVIKRFM